MAERSLVAATFEEPLKAHMAKELLEAAEIPCYLDGEFMVGVQPLYSQAVGGVKLMVPESFAQQAVEILQEHFADLRAQAEASKGHCPACGSAEVAIHSAGWFLTLLGVVTLGAAWLLFHRGHRCRACGHTW